MFTLYIVTNVDNSLNRLKIISIHEYKSIVFDRLERILSSLGFNYCTDYYSVSVYKNIKTVMLDKLVPEDILSEGHQSELVTYKGVMVSKEHSDKDIFKINLLGLLDNIRHIFLLIFLHHFISMISMCLRVYFVKNLIKIKYYLL